MKKVLLHIAAAVSLAIMGFTVMEYRYAIRHPFQYGWPSHWVASAVLSCIYLGLLLVYFFAIRGLKKREGKGLWVYSLLVFLAICMCLFPWFANESWVITEGSEKGVPFAFFFAAPPMLIPLMPLAKKGKWALPATLFALMALCFGVMTWVWDQAYNWDRKEPLLFETTYCTNKVLVCDATHEYSDGLLLTVDEAGQVYAYVSKVTNSSEGRQPTEVFSVRREGNEFVFYKDFYEDENQDQPVLSIPCLRGHIWDDFESAYCVRMTYQENPLFTNDKLSGIYCHLEYTDRSDVGTDDPLAGRRPKDWPGVAWDLLDQHFVIGEDHALTNDRDMTLLWTYTDDCFILAKRQEGPDGVTYKPWACGRKQAGRGVYDVKNIGTGVWWNGMGDFVYTDHDSGDRGVIWPGEPLQKVWEARLKDGWQEVPLRDEFASFLCLLEKDGKRTVLFFAEAGDAYSWADWSDEIDPREQLVTGYALLSPDGSLETWGGLVPVEAEQTGHLLSLLNTRSRIGSFGYIDWQASWPARTRLTDDGRLILRNEAGEWTVIPLSDMLKK